MSGSVLADAFAHHAWATMQLIDVCRALNAEQLATSVPGTYGSILDTIRHVVGADASYLNLLTTGRGGGPVRAALESVGRAARRHSWRPSAGRLLGTGVRRSGGPDRHRPSLRRSGAALRLTI